MVHYSWILLTTDITKKIPNCHWSVNYHYPCQDIFSWNTRIKKWCVGDCSEQLLKALKFSKLYSFCSFMVDAVFFFYFKKYHRIQKTRLFVKPIPYAVLPVKSWDVVLGGFFCLFGLCLFGFFFLFFWVFFKQLNFKRSFIVTNGESRYRTPEISLTFYWKYEQEEKQEL